MQRKVSPSLLQRQGFNIKSSFISQYTPEAREKTTQLTFSKLLSSSTFLEQSRPTFAATRKPTRMDQEYPHANSPPQLMRARSAKNNEEGKFKSLQVIEEPQLGVLGESTQRLRTEELLFKLKVRFGSLLKEASASEEEVTRFGQLTKVDELILFVTERLRRALSQVSSQATNSTSSNHKDREALEQTRAELEQARGKLQQRETSEKGLKGRLKEAHTELKQLYDRVNVKEKEYSQRTTELYQLRVQMKQQDKAADTMRTRLQIVEKDRNQLKSLMDSAGKDHSGILYTLKQEKEQLQTETVQLKEEVTRAKQRCTKLQELNEHLNEQLTRWRERVQFQGDPESEREREKSQEGAPHTPNDLTGASLNELKKSTMSMNSAYISKFNNSVRVHSLTALEIDNTRLRLQVADLQKENVHLQRTLLNYAPLKLKYQQTLEGVQADFSQGLDPKKLEYLKEQSGELLRVELEGHFRRRTEQIAREWKQKLYDIICKYEDELQHLKNDIQTLKHQRQLAEKKICSLANEKYLTETRLIEVEKELYTFNRHRSSKSLLSFAHQEELQSLEKQSQGRSSQEVIISNPHLLPIQEEESPIKFRDGPADNISVFSIREEEVCLHPEHVLQ